MTTQTKIKNNVLWFTIFFSVVLSNHSSQFSLVSCYVIIQLIYNLFVLSLIIKLGIIPVFTFGFWKSYICTCQTRKHHCGSQRSRFVLLIGLCWQSNAGRLHKCNTWIKPPSHIPYIYFHADFLFLQTWYVCLSMQDSHTDVNRHLGDTWLLWVFLQI